MIDSSKAKTDPFYVANQSIDIVGNMAILALSGGKESLCCLDLIHDRFESIYCYHLYWVKGLSFRENQFSALLRRYQKIKDILQIPHPAMSEVLSVGYRRFKTAYSESVKPVRFSDIDNYVRAKFGCEWIFSGERISDSITRQAMIKPHGGIDFTRQRVFPVAWWSEKQVYTYLKSRRIPLPSDYGIAFSASRKGRRQNGLSGSEAKTFRELQKRYPEDAKKIIEVFPLIQESAFLLELNEGRDHVEMHTINKKRSKKEGKQPELSEEDAEQVSDS